jgi:monofunctional glycosyltransferase
MIFVLVPVYSFVNPVSMLMLTRWITGRTVVREWKPLDQISPNLVRAVIAAEDSRYCTHHGIDWIEINRAVDDAEDLSEVRGASTIPMQTAKNLFLWPGRQVVRKALEIPIAYYMSLMWTKRRLFEIYLNIAEWGPHGEFGAEAAAKHAFGKSAIALSSSEAALLAAVLPSPKRRDAARPSASLRRTAARYRSVADLSITACLTSK